MRGLKWPGGSLCVLITGVTIMSPGGSTSPSGTKMSRPAELKVMGTGSTHFASGSLGVILSGPLPFLPLDSWTHESWLWLKQLHMVDADSEHRHPAGEPSKALKILAPYGHCSCVFKMLLYHSVKPAYPGQRGTWCRQWIPWSWVRYSISVAGKCVPQSEVTSHGKLRWWLWRSASPGAVLAEALSAEKANLYPE